MDALVRDEARVWEFEASPWQESQRSREFYGNSLAASLRAFGDGAGNAPGQVRLGLVPGQGRGLLLPCGCL